MDSTYNGSGVQQLENDYYTLAGRLIGERESGVTVFLLTDELGSVITSISAAAGSAAVTSNQVYSPYGSPRYRKGTAPTTKGFTGQYHDGSGLDYYNARYYDPVVGRFVSADIKQGNAQGMDPYSYVGNNPETRNDPTGQRRCDSAGECETSPGSGNGGGGNPPPSGCTWNGRPCTKTNNPCIGTVWNGSGCIPKPDHTQAKLDVRKNHLAPKIFYAITLLVSGGLILLLIDIYAIKHGIDDVDLPAILGALGDAIGALSELAGGLSLVSPSIGAIAFGLLGALHGLYMIANGVLGAYNAVMGGAKWLEGVIQSALDVIDLGVGGIPGALFKVADQLFGKALVFGGRALGHGLMMLGNGGLADAVVQQSMNIDDWCTRYGQDEPACTAA